MRARANAVDSKEYMLMATVRSIPTQGVCSLSCVLKFRRVSVMLKFILGVLLLPSAMRVTQPPWPPPAGFAPTSGGAELYAIPWPSLIGKESFKLWQVTSIQDTVTSHSAGQSHCHVFSHILTTEPHTICLIPVNRLRAWYISEVLLLFGKVSIINYGFPSRDDEITKGEMYRPWDPGNSFCRSCIRIGQSMIHRMAIQHKLGAVIGVFLTLGTVRKIVLHLGQPSHPRVCMRKMVLHCLIIALTTSCGATWQGFIFVPDAIVDLLSMRSVQLQPWPPPMHPRAELIMHFPFPLYVLFAIQVVRQPKCASVLMRCSLWPIFVARSQMANRLFHPLINIATAINAQLHDAKNSEALHILNPWLAKPFMLVCLLKIGLNWCGTCYVELQCRPPHWTLHFPISATIKDAHHILEDSVLIHVWCYNLSMMRRHSFYPSVGERKALSIAAAFVLGSQGILQVANSVKWITTIFLRSIKCLQFSWDPGGSNVTHRFEGKPNFKKGRMLGTDGPLCGEAQVIQGQPKYAHGCQCYKRSRIQRKR